MAKRKNKMTREIDLVTDDLVEKLSSLGDVSSRKMFGGVGIFRSGKMFALVNSSATAFLKTDDETSGKFEKLESARFGKMPYHEIPESILNHQQKLLDWARISSALALKKW